ncbi:TPR repeat, SEL1 subfamily protein [Gilliamella apicola SCGC AB-598-B02]|nr:TPR repeat, SEL1 subfamily protein [Gilliamella apicola SCGC AB-598-B02]
MEQQKTELDIEQRIEQLKKITRKDSKKKYALAQFELSGIYYLYKKDWQQAIQHLLNIKQEDNPKIYANVQFNLGFIYQKEKNDIEQAEQYYLNVEKQDNPQIYSDAQFCLGYIYQYDKNNIEKAEQFYLNVDKQGNPKVYAQAQFNLGFIYHTVKHNIEKAEHFYLNVKKEDNPEKYAQAQYNLGVIYRNEKNDIEKAEQYYLNVEKQDNPKVYAQAQLNLGIIYERAKHNIEQAEHCYLNVKKEDNPKVYAQAQYNLGLIYQLKKQDIKQAELYYLNIEKQDNPEVYACAQCILGDNVFFKKTKNNVKKPEEYYQNVAYFDESFKSYIIAQIMLSVISNKNSSIFEEEQRNNLVIKIFYIRKLTIEIQEELLVKFNLNESENNDGLVFEREVAHYTKPEVLFNLLKNKNKPSDFRLNVIDFMNDPTENQILTDWLDINTENNNEIKTFLASFSFNHNSLNQFRLYGNENNIVGSSVSVVFNENFFGDDIKRIINPASINQFFNNTDLGLPIDDSAKSVVATMGLNNSNENLNQKSDKTRNYLNENSDPKNSETVAEKNITSSVGSLPLFRCLYFDPKNDYISIAKRNKYSFYLEYQNSHDLNVYNKWKAYLNSLKQTKKINTIRKKLKEIEKIVYLLKNPENPQQKEIIEKIGKIVYSLKNSKNPKPKEIIEKIVYLLKNSKNPEPKEIIEKIEKIIYLLKNSKNPELKEIIEKLVDSLKNLEKPKQKEIIEKITNLDQLIALALMPISCLVKHAAFEDEDECRMIYITNIADELIQAPKDYAYANSLFVNYGKIEDYLEKIYLGPQCQPHHKLWITNHVRTSQSKTRSKPIKVVQSEMPLR